jgi:hypothetical protein
VHADVGRVMAGRDGFWDRINWWQCGFAVLVPGACDGGHTPLMQALTLHLFAQYKRNTELSEMRCIYNG